MRKGFTLVEMMFATAISVLVMGMLASVFVGIPHTVKQTYFEADLSLRMRSLREKILFHAEQTHNGWVYAGLLSGGGDDDHFVAGDGKIKVLARAMKIDAGNVTSEKAQLNGQTIELDRDESGYFANRGVVGSLMDYWLCLDRSGDADARNYLQDDTYLEDRLLKDRNLYFITLCAKRTAGFGSVVHEERIVVPVFGTKQEKNDISVFHDNLLP